MSAARVRKRLSTRQLASFGVVTVGALALEAGAAQAHLPTENVYHPPACMANSTGAGGPTRSPHAISNVVLGNDNCSKVYDRAWFNVYLLKANGAAWVSALNAHGSGSCGYLTSGKQARATFFLHGNATKHSMKGTSYRET
jgi:hypothetical protein